MSVSISQLLGKKQKIADAEHTLKITLDAAEEGNLRLAASRGITAIIQATAAAVGAAPPIIRRAEAIIQTVRNIIQGVVIKKAALGSFGGRPASTFWSRPYGGTKRPREIKMPSLLPKLIKFPSVPREAPEFDPATEKTRRFPAIPEGVILPSKKPFELHTLLMELGVPPKKMILHPDGVMLFGEAVKQAQTILEKMVKTLPNLSKRFFAGLEFIPLGFLMRAV